MELRDLLCPGVDKRDLPVTLGRARRLGPSSVGFCESWKRRGHRDAGFTPTQKSPLLAELAKWTWDPIYFNGPCIRKLIPLSLSSGLRLPLLYAGRRGGSGDAPYAVPCLPPPCRARARRQAGAGGGFSPASLRPLHRLPTASAKR